MAPRAPRRVLITGVANFWGARLARLLVDDGVEVVGIDLREPPGGLAKRIVFVEGDLRSPDLAPVVRAAAPDTIVHNDILQFDDRDPTHPRRGRAVHDTNVVGTLQLLAACDGMDSVRTIVVRGSAAIYGSEPSAPAFFTEDLARRYPLRTRFQRDIGELEGLVETFARRHPRVTCTMLRVQPVLGRDLDTPITRLLALPVIPTMLGFDPRMQFVHQDDSVAALHAAVHRPYSGAVNVAGGGTVSLVRMLRRLKRPSLPIPHPLYATGARALRVEITEDMVRWLRFGRGVDTRRLTEELGFTPAYDTERTIQAVA